MISRLGKLYGDWASEEDVQIKFAKEAIDGHDQPDSAEFRSQQSGLIQAATSKYLKQYVENYKKEALDIRDEIANRYPRARQMDGYAFYEDPFNITGISIVGQHLKDCVEILKGLASKN
jgi:hypothetical protein